MPVNGALVPESNIRAWLLLQNHAAFLGKPPASPPPTPRSATTVSTPPPQIVRNQPLLDRLSSNISDGAAPQEQLSEGSGGDSVDEAWAVCSDDASVRSIAFRSENETPPDAVAEPSPDDDCTPRHALGIAPTPNVDHILRPQKRGDVPTSFTGAEGGKGPFDMATVLATMLAMVEKRQALWLDERDVLLCAVASHTTRGRIGCPRAQEPVLPSVRRVSAASVSVAHAAAMTTPFVGLCLTDYVSFEVRRLCTMEASGRALIESEQGRLRIEAVEYPSFRRTAQCTVAKLEKLYWKQERELRGVLRNAEREHRSANGYAASSVATPSTPVPVPTQQHDVQLLEQLRSLLMEADEVVWPSLKDVSLNASSITAEDVGALEAVTVLLCKELREVRDALQDRNAMAYKEQSTLHHPLPPLAHRHGSATPLSVTTPKGSSRDQAAASPESITAKANSIRPDMGAMVAALLEQNQVLLEGLQHAESCGYKVPPDIMRRLKLLAT